MDPDTKAALNASLSGEHPDRNVKCASEQTSSPLHFTGPWSFDRNSRYYRPDLAKDNDDLQDLVQRCLKRAKASALGTPAEGEARGSGMQRAPAFGNIIRVAPLGSATATDACAPAQRPAATPGTRRTARGRRCGALRGKCAAGQRPSARRAPRQVLATIPEGWEVGKRPAEARSEESAQSLLTIAFGSHSMEDSSQTSCPA